MGLPFIINNSINSIMFFAKLFPCCSQREAHHQEYFLGENSIEFKNEGRFDENFRLKRGDRRERRKTAKLERRSSKFQTPFGETPGEPDDDEKDAFNHPYFADSVDIMKLLLQR